MGGRIYVVYENYYRIQLLNREGFNEATVSIPYNSSNSGEASLELKAQTINMGENGTVQITKVDKERRYSILKRR